MKPELSWINCLNVRFFKHTIFALVSEEQRKSGGKYKSYKIYRSLILIVLSPLFICLILLNLEILCAYHVSGTF